MASPPTRPQHQSLGGSTQSSTSLRRNEPWEALTARHLGVLPPSWVKSVTHRLQLTSLVNTRHHERDLDLKGTFPSLWTYTGCQAPAQGCSSTCLPQRA